MKIKQLNIIDFSGTHDRVLEFSDGFNIIEGKNESGKSTIGMFIKFMFYGFTDKAERERYYSWGAFRAVGTMTVEADGKVYRIEREYTEGRGDKVKIIDIAAGAPVEDALSPAEMFLGVPVNVFVATAFVGQADAKRSCDAKLGSAIENLLFSADESVNTELALKSLDDARIRLYYKNLKGGKIYDLCKERDELLIRLEKAKTSNAELIEKEGTLREIRAKIEENAENALETEKSLNYYETAKKYRELSKRNSLKEKMNEAQAGYEEFRKNKEENGFVPDNDYIVELQTLDKKVDELIAEAEKERSELSAHTIVNEDMGQLMLFLGNISAHGGVGSIRAMLDAIDKKRKRSAVLAVLFAVFGAVCAAAAAVMGLTNILDRYISRLPVGKSKLFIGAAGAALVFIVLSVIFLISRARQKMTENEIVVDLDADSRDELERTLSGVDLAETKLSIYRAGISDRERKIKELTAEAEKDHSRITELLEKIGCDNVRDAVATAEYMISRENELIAEKEKYRLAMETLGATYDPANEEALLKELDGRPYGEEYFDENAHEEELKKLAFYRSANESLEAKRTALEKDIAVLTVAAEPPTVLADRLLCLENEINTLSKRHKAYLLAYDRLKQAANDLRGSISPRLSHRAGEMMKELTAERYGGMGVAGDMSMEYVGSDGMTHSVDFMSDGTQDIAYVSLRLALIELLFKEKRPPMIFDESFSRLDEERLSAMLKLIRDTVRNGSQVLLFTSGKRDFDIASANNIPHRHIELRRNNI